MTISSTKVVSQKKNKNNDAEQQPSQYDEGYLKSQIFELLGKPKNLHRIDFKKVGDFNFRVNIYCDVGSENSYKIRILHSYFILIDRNNKLVKSNPTIEKKYE